VAQTNKRRKGIKHYQGRKKGGGDIRVRSMIKKKRDPEIDPNQDSLDLLERIIGDVFQE